MVRLEARPSTHKDASVAHSGKDRAVGRKGSFGRLRTKAFLAAVLRVGSTRLRHDRDATLGQFGLDEMIACGEDLGVAPRAGMLLAVEGDVLLGLPPEVVLRGADVLRLAAEEVAQRTPTIPRTVRTADRRRVRAGRVRCADHRRPPVDLVGLEIHAAQRGEQRTIVSVSARAFPVPSTTVAVCMAATPISL